MSLQAHQEHNLLAMVVNIYHMLFYMPLKTLFEKKIWFEYQIRASFGDLKLCSTFRCILIGRNSRCCEQIDDLLLEITFKKTNRLMRILRARKSDQNQL